MFGIDKSVLSRWEVVLLIFVIISVLVIAGGYASYAIISSEQNPAGHGMIVKNGDTVHVDYIGMFEDGTIFDTSIRSVAENNTLYPKSLAFLPKAEYSPLSFTVGEGQMIPGFDKGVVGMAVNQTKTLTVPPELGYGHQDEDLIETRSLTETVPIFEWFGNTTKFIERFNIHPHVGINVKNMRYGWNMSVFHVDTLADKILMRNNPFLGETTQSFYGWHSKVVAIDSSANMGNGEILLRHLISQDDIGTRVFMDEHERHFTVSSIDVSSGTYVVDFNRMVTGRTLIFKVTVVSIVPAPDTPQ